MKEKITILVTIWILEIFAFVRWFGCWQFKDNFYFTPQILANAVLNATNSDRGVPLLVTRALHNKVFALAWGLLQTVLQYWDIRFLEEFLSIAGGVGVFFALWYVLGQGKKGKLGWVLIGLIVVLSVLEAFFLPHFPYGERIIPLAIVFQLLSLLGMWQFLSRGNKKWRYLLLIAILGVSIVSLLLFPQAYQAFCVKI